MIELELDGKKVSANPGSNILEIALREGRYIPHFCYHKKLSIAANCRMCLVEVEKAPKPLPACATPVTDGMKVHTCSKFALEAQKGVMEFLLINHPLDCPICDQAGECQLQDLALGYGRVNTRFTESKRVVANKELGPLVATDMTRCIHCSRCVRFTDEIAGFQELGMGYRNNHVEVMPFIGKTIDSELSGNIIDICPVGALTSKPFRYKYRSWELSRRKSIAPHDGLGSNIIVQVDKYHKVARVLPLENEEINECWLSDRDRFSYCGLYHEDRVTEPMIKQDGKWVGVTWDVALAYVAKNIDKIKNDFTSDSIGVLASTHSTTEELYLLQKLMRSLGIKNIDSRLSQADFSLDNWSKDTLTLGTKIVDFPKSKALLVVGSVLREEQPLLASKIRQAVKNSMQLHVINVIKEELLCPVNNQLVIDPREFVYSLAQVAKASGIEDQQFDLSQVEVSQFARDVADSLKQGGYIVLGAVAKSLPNYGQILALTHAISKKLNCKFGVLASSSNEVGADIIGFLPYKAPFNQLLEESGLNVEQMLLSPRRAYMLFNTELEHDIYDSALALSALDKADTVMVFTAFINENMKNYADVILPIAPFTETAGSYVNMEGKWQKFNGVTKPLGDSKPGWKVIRVLANNLNIMGFDYTNIEEVRAELSALNDINIASDCTVKIDHKLVISKPNLTSLVRCGLKWIYSIDSITRRSLPLQQTKQSYSTTLSVNNKLAARLNLANNCSIRVNQGNNSRLLNVAIADNIPDTVVLLSVTNETHNIGGRFAEILLDKG